MTIHFKQHQEVPNLKRDRKLVELKIGYKPGHCSEQFSQLINALDSLQEKSLDAAVDPQEARAAL